MRPVHEQYGHDTLKTVRRYEKDLSLYVSVKGRLMTDANIFWELNQTITVKAANYFDEHL